MEDINDKLKDAVVAAALERASAVRFSFWPNGNRREGKNDAQFTGRVTVNTLVLGEMVANAIKEGKPEVELWADMWHNEPSTTSGGTQRPTLSGKARNIVAPKATSAQPADAPLASESAAAG